MSYMSDLSVALIETHYDRSYPYPEEQLIFRIESIVDQYLQNGGDFAAVELVLSHNDETYNFIDKELLYSSECISSPSTLIKCLKTAICILNKTEDRRLKKIDILYRLKQIYNPERFQIKPNNNKAVA